MMKQQKIVIIGIGLVAEPIARAIAELDGATLVAGSCRTRDKGEAFAKKHGCRWYDDYQRMLDDERPDVAIICTPSGAHLEPALACARRGINILCEKPIEISTQRTEQMIEAAESAAVMLGGIFPQRFNPVVGAVHAAAAGGRFGSLAVIAATVPWWRDDAYYAPGRWQGTLALDGGGALMNQAIHAVDYMQWIAAATMPELSAETNPVAEVFAFTANRSHLGGQMEVEDTAVAVLRFRNGALGQILGATSMYPGSLRRLIVSGRDGTAEVQEDQLIHFSFRTDSPHDESIRRQFGEATASAHGSSDPGAFPHVNHQRNIAHFLSALSAGEGLTLSGREATKAVAIIEACYESARTGQSVRLPI